MTLRIRTFHNAMCVIETPDLKICCDGWTNDGIMDGSWAVWPPCADLFERVGKVDIIWISHLHSDHCAPDFLRRYLARYPDTIIMVAKFKHNWLARRLTNEGIPHIVANRFADGETTLACFPMDANENDIDSALAVRWRNQQIVNMNDCDFVPDHVARIKEFADDVTVAMLPASGAGSWPHTFFGVGMELSDMCSQKSGLNLARLTAFRHALSPKAVVPFAGSYALVGRHHYLNPYRGIVDPAILRIADGSVIAPADHGEGVLDCGTLQATAERKEPYSAIRLAQFGLERAHWPYTYETGPMPPTAHLRGLLYRAAGNRAKYSGVNLDHWYCFQIDGEWLALNTNRADSLPDRRKEVASLSPRTEIYIDPRYLHGLLTGIYNWGTAQGGSHFMSRRHGIGYVREVDDWLLGLHV